MTEDRPPGDRHQEVRELLGALALGALPDTDEAAVRAHLDGCPGCRAELAEIAPLAEALRLVDPERLPGPVSPPAALGQRISEAVRAESVLRDRREERERRRDRFRRLAVPALTAGAAVLATVLVLDLADDGPAATVPSEQLVATSLSPAVSVSSARLVAHTWGIEVKLVAAGLDPGKAYRATVHARDGRDLPAGEFLGTGATTLRCNLQAALLRQDAVSFTVLDAAGRDVVEVALEEQA